MSTSVALLKILSACPEGRAGFEQLKADLAILSTRDWLSRIRALAAQSGPVNLFSDGLATRDARGWAITAKGRAFLDALESGQASPRQAVRPELRVISSSAASGSRPEAARPPLAAMPDRAAG
jgi:hypothetical protein